MAALNVILAARMVAETEIFTVAEVAKRNETSKQTVRNHLAREAKGLEAEAAPQFAQFAQACRRERDALLAEKERRRHEWADLAVSSLRALLGALEESGNKSRDEFTEGKIEKGRIRELAGAVKIVGELSLGNNILGGSSAARKTGSSSETAGDGGESGSGRKPGVH